MTATTSEIYRAAAADLQQGWHQGAWLNPHGKGKCLVRALADAIGDDAENPELPTALIEPLDAELMKQLNYQTLKIRFSNEYQDAPGCFKQMVLIAWNDGDDRQLHEVTDLLNNVADDLELEQLRAENQLLKQYLNTLLVVIFAQLGKNQRLHRLTTSLADRISPVHPELDEDTDDTHDAAASLSLAPTLTATS